MHRALALILIIVIPIIIFVYLDRNGVTLPSSVFDNRPVVSVGDVPIRVEIADSEAERTQGLSGRDSLESTAGLLFIFPESDYHGMWMKDMQFPIDIIWVDENLRVVDITKDLRPETYPRIFEPKEPVRFVIEVNGRYVDSFGIQEGDYVTIPKKLLPEDLQ